MAAKFILTRIFRVTAKISDICLASDEQNTSNFVCCFWGSFIHPKTVFALSKGSRKKDKSSFFSGPATKRGGGKVWPLRKKNFF